MHKIIHKLIRINQKNMNIAADINAVISTGEPGVSQSSAYSYSRIVQRSGRTGTESQRSQPTEKEASDRQTET